MKMSGLGVKIYCYSVFIYGKSMWNAMQYNTATTYMVYVAIYSPFDPQEDTDGLRKKGYRRF
jgi:hypothetical protein